MLDRILKTNTRSDRHGARARHDSKNSRRQLLVEVLEGRQLLTASLAPIASFSVPAQMGYQLALDGSGTKDDQTFTATSSNPNIIVSVAQGPFWTIKVSHQADSTPGDITFSNQPMTFQLFQNLTPNTVARITNFTNDGYYTQTGKYFPRVNPSFVAQGGSDNPKSLSSSSGVPPIANEVVQQLAFNSSAQLAMANGGAGTVSNDAQFFITYGSQPGLDYGFSLFGQLVSGQQTLTDMSNVARVVGYPTVDGTTPSQPVNPIMITSASLSQTNPNGVLLIDTTSATANQTATITVTATDPTDHTTATRSFTVTVGAYNGPKDPPINFVPLITPVSVSTNVNAPVKVQLGGTSGYPDTATPATLTWQRISQPAHGTISQFNSSTGALVYTPNTNYTGLDTFQYKVISSGPMAGPNNISSLPATATLIVGAADTGAVHLIDQNVLVVTPLPRTDHGTDKIDVSQVADPTVSGGQKIVVLVNGIPDLIQPPSNSLLQIIVFGGKASTDIQVDSNVSPTIPITLDGGHGGHNVIQAGAGPTREHGWFGHTLLIGGTGSNELIGRKGFVRFKPTATTNLIYAGAIKPRFKHRTVPPSGTYYRYVNGRLVPVLTT